MREFDRTHPSRPFLRTEVAARLGAPLATDPVASVIVHPPHGVRAKLRLTEGRWHIHPLVNGTLGESLASFETEDAALEAYRADPDKYSK